MTMTIITFVVQGHQPQYKYMLHHIMSDVICIDIEVGKGVCTYC